jgi:hypothetical protein
MQTLLVPEIATGFALMVNGVVALQLPIVYDIDTVAPVATAVTTPLKESTVALEVAALDHIPPEILLYNVLLAPTHALATPVIAVGVVLTVTLFVT